MALKIITNGAVRPLFALADLDSKARANFDYVSGDDVFSDRFFRYRNEWYDVFDTPRAEGEIADAGWDGFASDSFWSGVAIKWDDDSEGVIVGWVYYE